MEAILDEKGKVREWLDQGRGVRRWVSEDIGAGRPDLFTPGDVTLPPHWAYPLHASELLEASQVVFFLKGSVYFGEDPRRPGRFTYAEWTDTPMGWKAAAAFADKLPSRNPAAAPLQFHYRYTVERVFYETKELRADGRPVGIHYRVAIIQWSAAADPDTAARIEQQTSSAAAEEAARRDGRIIPQQPAGEVSA
jgi:hypothetical protein